ncbi:MAG: hypothetical protein E7654_01185 [Ruminococcaceae bacterium]|nr:hypothetical protein [Oscillospiraceae bacterium]
MERQEKKNILSRRSRTVLICVLAAVGILFLWLGRSERGDDTAASASSDWRGEISALEAKAAALCSQVAGVEDVTVALSLAQGAEYVYAAGESSYLGTGNTGARLVTERPPQIGGIGVVCRGADDPETVQKLVSLLSAAFGVGANRIYIAAAG